MARPTLPNLVIAGLGRAGTTAMFQYLIEHPDVCGSKKKEPAYFTDELYGKPLAPIESYAALFDHHADERVVVEATPGYFSGGRAVAELIDRTLGPDAKILISLRDPVGRFVSWYDYALQRMWLEPGTTIDEYLDACRRSPSLREAGDESARVHQGYHGGFYADALSEWFSVFGDRLRVVFFERLQTDTAAFMTDVADWLGIDASFYEHREFDIYNPTRKFRMERVHRMANAVNDKAEFWLRRRPALKTRLRKAYALVNGAPRPEADDDTELREKLGADYADSNRLTGALLEARGYTDLPGWLSPDSE